MLSAFVTGLEVVMVVACIFLFAAALVWRELLMATVLAALLSACVALLITGG